MDPIEQFAAEAALFAQWLLEGTDQGAAAVQQALVRVTHLYVAALSLPPPWSDEVTDRPEVARLGHGDWERARTAAGRLPVDFYSEVYNPTAVPAGEPVTGSISDDLADIYRDVASGLRAYDHGNRSGAVWEWTFGLHSHWGAHATGAIRTLHWWLAENAIDRLSAGSHEAG